MKKLLIGVLAVACCVAFSAPVLAEIKIGGMISAEQFYWGVSKERRTGGGQADGYTNYNVGDYSSTEFAMGQPWNRINMQYISDDKKIGGMIEIRTGGQKGGGNSHSSQPVAGGGANTGYANPTGENNFVWELAYLDWHFNPNFYLRVGRQTQTFAIYSPDQQMGINQGHIVLSGFGNIHGATSRDGVRGYIKFNDMVRMEVQMLNPDSDGGGPPNSALTGNGPGRYGDIVLARPGYNGAAAQMPALVPAVANGGTSAVAESNTIPRLDLSLPIKSGNFSVEPSFSWQRSHYIDVAPGSDTDYDSWGAALGFKAGFGPFTLSGEYTYGQNLGGAAYVGAGNGAPSTYQQSVGGVAQTTNGYANVKIEDTKTHSAWMQAEFNFGPFAIQGIVGMEKAKNDGNPDIARATDPAEFDITRWAYGLQFPIMIAKNFKVVPQIWYYDYGKSADVGGNAATPRNGETDLGNEVTAGLFWQLTF